MDQLLHRPEYEKLTEDCRWLSITNGDNLYGRKVVENILSWRGGEGTDILLNPFDSRYFLDQGIITSISLSHALVHRMLRIELRAKGLAKDWSQRCLELESAFSIHLYGYGLVPRPALGKVDLAAIFFQKTNHKVGRSSTPFFR